VKLIKTPKGSEITYYNWQVAIVGVLFIVIGLFTLTSDDIPILISLFFILGGIGTTLLYGKNQIIFDGKNLIIRRKILLYKKEEQIPVNTITNFVIYLSRNSGPYSIHLGVNIKSSEGTGIKEMCMLHSKKIRRKGSSFQDLIKEEIIGIEKFEEFIAGTGKVLDLVKENVRY
jgi:hypothetical protein